MPPAIERHQDIEKRVDLFDRQVVGVTEIDKTGGAGRQCQLHGAARGIVLADGLEGANQLADEGLARAQAEAADKIVITKAHEADNQSLSRLAATLQKLAPDAALSFADFGVEVRIATRADAPPFDLGVASEAAEPIRAHRLDVETAGSCGALSVWLSTLLFVRGDSIVRVKGAIRTPAGRLLLQSVRGHVQPPEILPEPLDQSQATHDNFIVLIGRGIDKDRLRYSWDRFVTDPGAEPAAR
jgi:G3E family GTPase